MQYLYVTILKIPEIPLFSEQIEIPYYQRFSSVGCFNEAGANSCRVKRDKGKDFVDLQFLLYSLLWVFSRGSNYL